MKKIGVKYCGGCNPRFNRGDFVRKLKDKYKDLASIEPINENDVFDMIIIVSGCSSACVSCKNVKCTGEIFSVTSKDDFITVSEKIENIIN